MDRLAALTPRARAKAVVVRMALRKVFIVVPLRTVFDEEKVAEGYWGGCARAHRARKNPPASSSVSGGSCGAMVG